MFDPSQVDAECRFRAFLHLGERASPQSLRGLRDSSLCAFLGLRTGLLSRLLLETKRHAETRIMFQRPLSHQMSIMQRLVSCRASLWLIEDVATRCAQGFEQESKGILFTHLRRHLAWLRASSRLFQDECQQIAGGTGYMLESPIAQSVQSLEMVDTQQRALEAILPLEGQSTCTAGLLKDALTRRRSVSSPLVLLVRGCAQRGIFLGLPASADELNA